MSNSFHACIIDDMADSSHVFKNALNKLGCHVTVAESSEEKLRSLPKNGGIDLVFIPLTTREMSVRHLTRYFKTEHPECKVVLVTSWRGELDRHLLAHEGIHDVVHNPIRFNELKRVLFNQLG